MRDSFRKALFFLALIGLWELAGRLGLWPPYMLPRPSMVLLTLGAGFSDGSMPLAVLISLRRIALGFGISLAAGTTLGMALGMSSALRSTLGTIVVGLQALPSICWLPLALLWFGLNERAILFVVIMGAVLSITVSTEDGIRNIPPLFLRAAANMGARGLRLYTGVILPAALPSIITGIKLGWSFAWRSLMAGELLYVSMGLGHLLMMGRELNDMSQVIAVMVLLVAIGSFFDRLVFMRLQRTVAEKWGVAV
ncbi:MAG: ABC transporter permease [Patescibacteria group bacterium]